MPVPLGSRGVWGEVVRVEPTVERWPRWQPARRSGRSMNSTSPAALFTSSTNAVGRRGVSRWAKAADAVARMAAAVAAAVVSCHIRRHIMFVSDGSLAASW
jgi:hypothetical protein